MLASNRGPSAGASPVAGSVRKRHDPMPIAVLADWQRAYFRVPIDIVAKLLVLGVMLSLSVAATTREDYRGVEQTARRVLLRAHATRHQDLFVQPRRPPSEPNAPFQRPTIEPLRPNGMQ